MMGCSHWYDYEYMGVGQVAYGDRLRWRISKSLSMSFEKIQK